MTGVTFFVDRSNTQGTNDGYSTNPYRTVATGAAAASPGPGNILLIRPGNYNERITLNSPVTLRATRAGWATIGKP